MIKNRILNGGFETGTLSPFIVNNPSFVSINGSNSHSSVYSATLSGGLATAIIAQAVPVSPNETFELFVSLSKIGPFPSPLIAINVQYYNGNTFLGDGLVTFILSNRIPDNNEKDWLEVYGTTSPVPATANTASIVIAKFPALGSADVFIDDISLLSVGPPQSAFRAEKLGSQDFVEVSDIQVSYEDQIFDLNDEYDPFTSTFIPKQGGVYFVFAMVEAQLFGFDINHIAILKIYVNNILTLSSTGGYSVGLPVTPTLSVSGIIHLNAGDAVTVRYISLSSAGVIDGFPDSSHFEAARFPSPL
ncbi:NTTRR-F1 domain [Bacillus wiedmannii]|uniref:NTTRR-F1 domain n=1 Tax=Bacillus wiedmannii TaxID=1890302 RepID=UPI000BF05ED7|nr:NTTRR-F1 domain [Bacillus wiedmannii]PEJ95066.1 hypothetical protein CN690_28110 [Bacillus wiedmannii]